MNPTELTVEDGQQPGEQRNVFCPCYSRCLDAVVMRDWNHWTCRRCPRYSVAIGPSLEQFARSRRTDGD